MLNNIQGITKIEMHRTVRAFCPLGNDWYCGQIKITFSPDRVIPNYCHVDEFISSLDGNSFILEDVVYKVFNYMNTTYKPLALEVSCTAEDAVHLPVTVTKTL